MSFYRLSNIRNIRILAFRSNCTNNERPTAMNIWILYLTDQIRLTIWIIKKRMSIIRRYFSSAFIHCISLLFFWFISQRKSPVIFL